MSMAAENTALLIKNNLKADEKKSKAYDYLKVLKSKQKVKERKSNNLKKKGRSKSTRRNKSYQVIPKVVIPPKQEECSPEMKMHKARWARL